MWPMERCLSLPSPASVHLQAAVEWLGREWRSIAAAACFGPPLATRRGSDHLRLLARCGHGDMRNMAGDVSSF